MICLSSYTFDLFGGHPGPLINDELPAYLMTLAVYFIGNTLLIGLYYYIIYKGTLYETIKDIIKDSFVVYLCTLVLSLVLVVLIVHNSFFRACPILVPEHAALLLLQEIVLHVPQH